MTLSGTGRSGITLLLFALATFLRLLLCWQNPPYNYFDDHFEPIALIMKSGEIPRKDACFECYNPPVFYVAGAFTANALRSLGLDRDTIQKSLQFQNCFYNILTLLIVHLILLKLPSLSPFSRHAAFAAVCFLPRHIYMAALFSNDNLACLVAAVCVWLLLSALDFRRFWQLSGAALGLSTTMVVFIKYTGFAVLPMIAVACLVKGARASGKERMKPLQLMFMALLPPLLLLGSYMATNYHTYGELLPWNDKFVDTGRTQPRDAEPLNFYTFSPWSYIREPIQTPGKLHSFWTMIYSNAWFDTEPKFLHYTDWHTEWWTYYWSWRTGDGPFPAQVPPLSSATRIMAAVLLTVGIVPLVLVVAGLIASIRELFSKNDDCRAMEGYLPLLALLAGTTAIVVALALKAPVFSSMKATYLFCALPAFATLVARGVQLLATCRPANYFLAVVLIIIASLTSAHIVQIAWCIGSRG